MADVFVSYAAEDRDRAAKLSTALIELGWSVWWDRRIIAGQTFDQVIEQELDAAKSVVVLWSKHSIESEWVKNEAAAAAERDVLVPAAIDEVRLPLEFRRRQTADLTRWKGESAHGGFHALCEGLASKIGCEVPPKLAMPGPDAAPGSIAPATIRGDFGSRPAVGLIRANRRVIALAALASVLVVVIATLLFGKTTRESEQQPVVGNAAPSIAPGDATLEGKPELAPTVKESPGPGATPATTIASPAKTEPAGRPQTKSAPLATATPKVDPPKPSAGDCRLEALQRLQRGEVTIQKYQELLAQCR